jgi:hypothetical protein
VTIRVFFVFQLNNLFMSETKTPAREQQPATLAATNTRKVYEKLIGSARFQDSVENVVVVHGKHDALEYLNDITSYLGQAHLQTEIAPLTAEHFFLLNTLYNLVRSLPGENELREAGLKDMDGCKPAKPASHGND